jgi:hypothetical protein
LVDGNVNFKASNVVIITMDDVDLDENVTFGQIFSNVVQQRVIFINKTFVGLGRPSMPMSNPPPIHCAATMDSVIEEILDYINTNVGPSNASGNRTHGWQSSKGSHYK